jgi:hypothetical protein
MAEVFRSTSRFKNTEIIRINGHIAPALMNKFDFLQRDKLADDQILKIEVLGNRAGRPDLISQDIYGTTLFKWVLLLFNDVTNPFNGWPFANTAIEAPSRDAVWREL